MLFCPKCGTILKPKKTDTKRVMACSCGFIDKTAESRIVETLGKKGKDIEVMEKSDFEILPKTDIDCPKCGCKKAYYWLTQTRAADEAPTKFFACEKCKHTWRDYD